MDEASIIRNNRKQITNMVDAMSQEDMVWTIKYISDRMLVLRTKLSSEVTESADRPSWWYRPLLQSTLDLVPKERVELDENYKDSLAEILEEKYL